MGAKKIYQSPEFYEITITTGYQSEVSESSKEDAS